MIYEYNATVIKVIDGDTIRCLVDLGFSNYSKLVFRLSGINTPEIVGLHRRKALKAKQFVTDKILNKEVVIKTYKDKKEKYGRYLADVFIGDKLLNQMLLDEGLAEVYK